MGHVIIFTIDDQQFAFELAQVDRVIRSAEVSYFPNAPEYYLGIINIGGKGIPIINLRKVFGYPDRSIDIMDQFIICDVNGKKIGVWVDHVREVTFCPESQLTDADGSFSNENAIKYIVRRDQGITLVYDLQKLISKEELTSSVVA